MLPAVSPSSHPAGAAALSDAPFLTLKPAPVSVAVGPLFFWLTVAAGLMLGMLTNQAWGTGAVLWPLLAVSLCVMATARLIWEGLNWACTTYELRPDRVVCRFGVLSRIEVSIPLDKVQNIIIARRLRDRVVGIGSIGVDSAGSGAVEVWWLMVDKPAARADAIRAAVANAKAALAAPSSPLTLSMTTPTPPTPAPSPTSSTAPRPFIIGLTGSIGAGKTAAATIFREAGCLVIDSDAEARAALDRPEVAQTLVRWWGAPVLGPDGRVDRKAVGEIVFNDADERLRLERLIHPIVRKSRAELLERAQAAGQSTVVVDVPLLFEAGIDAECDATVFVDADREVRLRRVAGRGWDDAELARREAAQWPVEDKRRRADERLDNNGTLDDLRAALAETLVRLRARPRRPGA